MNILVTGASGFIGQPLCSALLAQGHSVRASVRSKTSTLSTLDLDVVAVGEVNGKTDWSDALSGIDCIIHCAARAHLMNESEVDALSEYRAINVAGTQHLADQAANLGVKRLVFVSSIKVNGEQTTLQAPFSINGLTREFPYSDDIITYQINPKDPYGISKWEAERALWSVSAKTGIEAVVVRPPLVYGPGVKGNMLRLLRWVAHGVPLPLAAVHNQRSLIGLANLSNLLICCAEHTDAAGQTFLASDGHDLSTPQLIQLIAKGMNRPARLFPVPVKLLQAGGFLLGKRNEINRLVNSLQVDSGYTQAQLC